jgi:antitoxin VapB
MQTTKIFKNGNSQAVRIPMEYRFEQDEVFINKIGSAVVIYSHNDRFAVLMESLNEFTSDFLEDGRPEQLTQSERESFR